jgi:pimeloyl-ACP methyl ester carboxylesterase
MALTTIQKLDPTRLAPGATARMVDAGTTRLYCVEAGKGRPVVLVGGWPQSLYCWRHVLPVLARTYRVIALDPPGLGDSEKPAPAYDMEAVAANVHAALDTLCVDVHDFVGFDIGMWIGYPFAMQRPERVRTLTLIDARIPGLVPWAPMSPASAVTSWHFPFNSLPELPELLIEGRERAFLAWLFRSRTPTPGIFDEAALDEYERVYCGRTAIASAVGYYRAIEASSRQIAVRLDGPKLAMPILAIAAGLGVGKTMTSALESIGTDVRAVIMDGCGHYVPEEAPQRLLDVLAPLLSRG